jgi:hypothetical protein
MESRALVEKINQVTELCVEDVSHSRAGIKEFLKTNRDHFTDDNCLVLLEVLECLDLIEDRLKEANEDLSDLLFGSDE